MFFEKHIQLSRRVLTVISKALLSSFIRPALVNNTPASKEGGNGRSERPLFFLTPTVIGYLAAWRERDEKGASTVFSGL